VSKNISSRFQDAFKTLSHKLTVTPKDETHDASPNMMTNDKDKKKEIKISCALLHYGVQADIS
jgi:hypothetical protein